MGEIHQETKHSCINVRVTQIMFAGQANNVEKPQAAKPGFTEKEDSTV